MAMKSSSVCALEPEKITKTKWIQWYGTPCIMTHNLSSFSLFGLFIGRFDEWLTPELIERWTLFLLKESELSITSWASSQHRQGSQEVQNGEVGSFRCKEKISRNRWDCFFKCIKSSTQKNIQTTQILKLVTYPLLPCPLGVRWSYNMINRCSTVSSPTLSPTVPW